MGMEYQMPWTPIVGIFDKRIATGILYNPEGKEADKHGDEGIACSSQNSIQDEHGWKEDVKDSNDDKIPMTQIQQLFHHLWTFASEPRAKNRMSADIVRVTILVIKNVASIRYGLFQVCWLHILTNEGGECYCKTHGRHGGKVIDPPCYAVCGICFYPKRSTTQYNATIPMATKGLLGSL